MLTQRGCSPSLASNLDGTAPAPGPEYQVSAGAEQAWRVGDRYIGSGWATWRSLSTGCTTDAWVDLPPSVSLVAIILRHGNLGLGPLEKTGLIVVSVMKFYKQLLFDLWILAAWRIIQGVSKRALQLWKLIEIYTEDIHNVLNCQNIAKHTEFYLG